jgi:hypothetical protein
MRRTCVLLSLLLVILTFNAYNAYCSSATEQPVRQTCDAFLELGPQSHASSVHDLPNLKLVDFDVTPQLPSSAFIVFRPEHPPRGADTRIHLSIPTTVLRN